MCQCILNLVWSGTFWMLSTHLDRKAPEIYKRLSPHGTQALRGSCACWSAPARWSWEIGLLPSSGAHWVALFSPEEFAGFVLTTFWRQHTVGRGDLICVDIVLFSCCKNILDFYMTCALDLCMWAVSFVWPWFPFDGYWTSWNLWEHNKFDISVQARKEILGGRQTDESLQWEAFEEIALYLKQD